MSFKVPKELESKLDELITHYPEKRSASLMFMHAIQEHFGFISPEALEWCATKLELQPINLYELLTFYPMFREKPVGTYQIKVCRTLSCMLGGSHNLHGHICKHLGVNPGNHGLQTTGDGRFSIEFVECLAGCGTAPVMMVNDEFHEAVDASKANEILEKCGSEK